MKRRGKVSFCIANSTPSQPQRFFVRLLGDIAKPVPHILYGGNVSHQTDRWEGRTSDDVKNVPTVKLRS